MCNKTVDNYANALELYSILMRLKKICNKAFGTSPESQEIIDVIVYIFPFLFKFASDQYKC